MHYILISIFLLSLPLIAQSSKKGTPQQVSVYTTDYAEGYKKAYLRKNPTEFYEIRLSTANIYGPFKTLSQDTSKVELCERIQAPVSEDSKTAYLYRPICIAKIPSSVKEPLLVLVPNKGELKYKAIVLDRSVTDFPMGSYKFINFSPRQVRGKIGKSLAKVAPWKLTEFNPSKDNSEDRLKVQFQYKEDESDWVTFGSTEWSNRIDKRTLLCSYIDPKSKRMKIRGIPLREPIIPDKE